MTQSSQQDSETVLAEAARLTSRDRNATYGTPLDNFGTTADLLSVRFRHKLKFAAVFTPEDVAAIMRMVKEARLVTTPGHRDSLVDICGYTRTEEMCIEERERRRQVGAVPTPPWVEVLGKYRNSPSLFAKEILGITLLPWQAAVMDLLNNDATIQVDPDGTILCNRITP